MKLRNPSVHMNGGYMSEEFGPKHPDENIHLGIVSELKTFQATILDEIIKKAHSWTDGSVVKALAEPG